MNLDLGFNVIYIAEKVADIGHVGASTGGIGMSCDINTCY